MLNAETKRAASEGAPHFRKGVLRWTALGYLLLRYAVAAVFMYAGALKATGPQRFALDIKSYRLVPASAAKLGAEYLPYLEMLCGAALLFRRTAPGGVLVAGGLMTAFTLALLSAWARGLEIRCGCFGGTDQAAADYARWLLRDLALLAGCALLWRRLTKEAMAGPI